MQIREFNIGHSGKKWIDIENPTVAELEQFCAQYHLQNHHILDCMEPDHLPKFEEYDGLHFIITRAITAKGNESEAHTIQTMSSKVAIFINTEIVISIHRVKQEFIEDLISRYIDTHKLATPLDVAIKIIKGVYRSYDQFQRSLSEQIEGIEELIFLKNRNENFMEELYYLKRKSVTAKKLLLFSSEILPSLKNHFHKTPDWQDAKDIHVKMDHFYDQLIDSVNNLMGVYLSNSAQKTNEVMKVLTIFSAFFLPLTFIVGIYGMNFDFMPELRWKFGYPLILVSMAFIVIIIGFWFKRRKWL